MALIARGDRTVPVTVQGRTAVPPAEAFATIVPIDLAMIFDSWGPFPGVRAVRNQTGEWDHVGASRNPELTDGSTATEVMTEYVEGVSFAYELTEVTNVLARLVHGMRGEWTFTPDGRGTVVRWTYEFKPRAGVAPVLRAGLAPFWRRYMHQGLDRALGAADAASS